MNKDENDDMKGRAGGAKSTMRVLPLDDAVCGIGCRAEKFIWIESQQ